MATFRWQTSLIDGGEFSSCQSTFRLTEKRLIAVKNGEDLGIDYMESFFEGNALCRFLGVDAEVRGNTAVGVNFLWHYDTATDLFYFEVVSIDSGLQPVIRVRPPIPNTSKASDKLKEDKKDFDISENFMAHELLQSLNKPLPIPDFQVTVYAIIRVANGSDKLFFNLAMQKAGNSTEYLLGLACPPFHYPNI